MTGGDDTITSSAGINVILGGTGADTIKAPGGDNIILGDNGQVNLNGSDSNDVLTTEPAIGGADIITGGVGNNIIIGGANEDTITGGLSNDVILGDGGYVHRNSEMAVTRVRTRDDATGGIDDIDGDAGNDVILGGAEGDNISALYDDNIILGDGGEVNLINTESNDIYTTNPSVGGEDIIIGGGNGSNIILGGAEGDMITGGTGNDVILGDNGRVSRDAASLVTVVTQVVTYDEDGLTGGDDTITSSAGSNVILGGTGADTIKAPGGDNIILGDNGQVNLNSINSNDVLTTEPAIGGADIITGGLGNNIIIGGANKDTITGGLSNDVILGDGGYVNRNSEMVVTRVRTRDDATGGVDTIDGGAGNDVILGGAEGDSISALFDDNIILGDGGEVNLINTVSNDIYTTNPSIGGVDIISGGGNGSNIILGGAEGDTIIGGNGNDVILGDNGQVFRDAYTVVTQVVTYDEDGLTGGDDTITSSAGSNVILGGTGADTIKAPGGDNIILGDNGQVNLNGSNSNDIFTTEPSIGGVDIITGGVGNNIIIGGAKGDEITGGSSDDVILGDGGYVSRSIQSIIKKINTINPSTGGEDTICGFDGQDIILGGASDDSIDGNLGNDILLGDSGMVIRSDGSNQEQDIFSSDTGIGGADTIAGNEGADIILGGAGEDLLYGNKGEDILLGDSGYITRDDATCFVQRVVTIDPDTGAGDIIEGNEGKDIALGGAGGDTIYGNLGDDILLGDNGVVVLVEEGQEDKDVFTTDPAKGGLDTIYGNGGNDFILGGATADTIQGDAGNDFILGDNGYLHRDSSEVVEMVNSTDASIGGGDIICGNNGDDIVLGGAYSDNIFGSLGNDTVLGDNGVVDFVSLNGNAAIVDIIQTTYPTIGGDDSIDTGEDSDIVLGGLGNDLIDAGTDKGCDIVVGDNGVIIFDAGGLLIDISTSAPETGGDDQIVVGDGNDIVLGGIGTDYINIDTTTLTLQPIITEDSGKDVLLGDNGFAEFDENGLLKIIKTTEPTLGGPDFIAGGGGCDVILGGTDGDTIYGQGECDLILGDNGQIDYIVDQDSTSLDLATVIDPTIGGDDTIYAGKGKDVVFGGTGDDTIYGGNNPNSIDTTNIPDDHDVLLGDHGKLDKSLPVDQNFVSLFTGLNQGAGDDEIHGDAGDDFILGQQGDDLLYGDAGEDDITGGHNVLYGVDGNDYIEGGEDADVMLGDNGLIIRTLISGQNCGEPVEWLQYPAPFEQVIRQVFRFDDIDFIQGNDEIHGDAGDDIIHGQRGEDTIYGGAGDDEVYGELGPDAIDGNEGNDILIADVGKIIRKFNYDGTPQINENGSWHRDVFLEDVGIITGLIDIDTTPLRDTDLFLADEIMSADLVLITGSFDADGSKHLNDDNGAWDTDILLIDLVDIDNDLLDGGDGEDILFGQRGNDTLLGGDDADMIFGDSASNTVQFETDIPHIINGIRLIRIDGSADIPITLEVEGSVIVPSVSLEPKELALIAPGVIIIPTVEDVFREVVGDNTLQRTDGASIVPYASIVPDLVHHTDILPGNDYIDGGNGNDLIFGDNGHFFSPLTTEFKEIEKAMDDVISALFEVLHGLYHLSFDYDLVEHTILGVEHEHDVVIGNDTIFGGAGDDIIIGDNGALLAPATKDVPIAPEGLPGTALDYYNFLRDLEYVATDFEYVIQEANVQALEMLVDDAIMNNPQKKKLKKGDFIDPDHHGLFIGNDVINGNDGNDFIIGDGGTIFTPLVTSKEFKENAEDSTAVDKEIIKLTETALKEQKEARKELLKQHIKIDHDDFKKRQPANKDVDLIPYRFEFDYFVGNDALTGDAGDDVIIGDFGMIVLPAMLENAMTKKGIRDINKDINKLVEHFLRDFHHLFIDHHNHHHINHHSYYHHHHYSDNHLNGSNDILYGGDGNDILLGDNGAIVPIFSEDVPGWENDMLVIPQDNHSFGHNGGTKGGNDVLLGGDGDDMLLGQDGDDTLEGGDGDDKLYGGKGKDTLDGGFGKDILKKNGSVGGSDDKEDFVVTLDSPLLQYFLMDVVGAIDNLDPNSYLWNHAVK